MATGRKAKISKVEEEKRRETFQRGIKQGSLKNTIDKAVDKVGNPIADSFKDILKKVHPNAGIADPAVDAFVKNSFMLGFAEIMGASKAVGEKVPGLKKIDAEKYDEFAAYIRGYTGERMGTQTADGMFKVIPAMMEMLGNPELSSILNNIGDDKPALPEPKNTYVNLEDAVAKLDDEDD